MGELTKDDCLDFGNPSMDPCRGAVEYRMSLSATGRSFPRCNGHWALALRRDQQTRARYPESQPADFDPMYAGEYWGEDY